MAERTWKNSPDCIGYAVEQSGTAFERKAGPKFIASPIVSLRIKYLTIYLNIFLILIPMLLRQLTLVLRTHSATCSTVIRSINRLL